MSATIHPTLLLRMDLDESLYNDETVAEIKRSYSYVAPATIVSHPTKSESIENSLRFIVKLTYPYWDSDVEGADEIWDGPMNKWLGNMFYKVSSTLVAYNRVAREDDRSGLDFSWLELEFGEQVVIVHLNADSSIPDEARDLVNQVHSLSNTGLLKELSLEAVRLPSRQSYAEQETIARAQFAAKKATEVEVDSQDAPIGEVAIYGSVSDEADTAEDIDESVTNEDTQTATPKAPIAFVIDFSIWGLEFADGLQKQYNPDSDSLIA